MCKQGKANQAKHKQSLVRELTEKGLVTGMIPQEPETVLQTMKETGHTVEEMANELHKHRTLKNPFTRR